MRSEKQSTQSQVAQHVPTLAVICIMATCFCSCKGGEDKLFSLLPSSETSIVFNNKLTESDTFNVLSFEYIYNGAGVGVGDVNNDGLADIFFAGNMVSSSLYLNKGNFKFEDITEKASIQTNVWCTGVAMVDINQDGLLDVYVSTIQPSSKKSPIPNLLFLNKGLDENGVPAFEEVAANVGLADSSYATQAAFLDYDLDGDLDVYILANALESYNRNQIMGLRDDGTGKSVDKFYRNEGIVDGLPVFKDVSKEVGVQSEGWGLGIVVNDINSDGYPDIYVANDFMSNDHLYINTGQGKFVNRIRSILKHQEQNGMGIDMADINNDGLNDIVVLDMLPDDNLRQKTMFSTTGYDRFRMFREKGYEYQYIRNVLQLNNGNNTFSDIGYLAGVYATDWSWSALLADFDNDGYRDLFVGNGYRKDITDQDFIAYSKEFSMFSTDRNRMNSIRKEIEKLSGVRKPNFLFRNNGDLTFSDKAKDWGLDQPSYSNGAAYADFDNDGDLDLVTNNINDEAFVYRNNLIKEKTQSANRFLRIRLIGEKGNLQGYGAKIEIYTDGKQYYAEHQTVRGYKSTVESVEHFGLGQVGKGKIDSLKITWPGEKVQKLHDVPVNQVITLNSSDAVANGKSIMPVMNTLLRESHHQFHLDYKHDEEDFGDFLHGQFLLPHKHSQGTPGIAVGDINGDGLDDFIIGGSANKSATYFIQKSDGTFEQKSFVNKDAEDMGLLLFDADNDGDQDLYCVSGSSEFKGDKQKYQNRFYRNDGDGKFQLDQQALPEITSSGSCVVANDFDHDGDLDLFVGGRVVPMRYPEAPESYLLINDGKGKFENRTDTFASTLRNIGMVTSALWSDINNDGWTDLIVVGEWMPVTFFINDQGKSFTHTSIPNSTGWWNSISGGDFDNDGDIDYVAGNLGLNSIYKASVDEPIAIYAKDFDNNGSVDPILCRYIQGKEYPVHPRETLTSQVASLRGVVQKYAQYGGMGVHDLFSKERFENTLVLKSSLLASVYINNNGGKFEIHPLPVEAQFSPMFGTIISDVDEDGNLDVLAVGNSYATEVLTGYYDAGVANFLKGDGNGNFHSVPVRKSGFFADGDSKAAATLMSAYGRALFLVTQNRDSLKVFSKTPALEDQRSNLSAKRLHAQDQFATITLTNGKKRKQEMYLGSGYLSSSSNFIIKNANVSAIDIIHKIETNP